MGRWGRFIDLTRSTNECSHLIVDYGTGRKRVLPPMMEAMRRVARNIFGEGYSTMIICWVSWGATKKYLLQVCYALQLVELKSLELNHKRFLESESIRLKTKCAYSAPGFFGPFPPTEIQKLRLKNWKNPLWVLVLPWQVTTGGDAVRCTSKRSRVQDAHTQYCMYMYYSYVSNVDQTIFKINRWGISILHIYTLCKYIENGCKGEMEERGKEKE